MASQPGKDGRSKRDIIMDKLLELAQSGEQWAVREVLDRLEGKAIARQQIDHTTQGQSLNLSISFGNQALQAGTELTLPEPDNEEAEKG